MLQSEEAFTVPSRTLGTVCFYSLCLREPQAPLFQSQCPAPVIEAIEMTRVLKTPTHTLCLREPQAPVIEVLEMTRVLKTPTHTLCLRCLREPQAPFDAAASLQFSANSQISKFAQPLNN